MKGTKMKSEQDDLKERKLKSLKDLGSKMREMHASSVKPEPSKMDREDEEHDDLNESHSTSRSYFKTKSQPDNEAVRDEHGGNPAMPSNAKDVGKANQQSNSGDSEETHDEHGPLSASEPANEESNESPKDLHRSQREDSMHEDNNAEPHSFEGSHERFQQDTRPQGHFGAENDTPEEESDELAPLTLHPGLMKLLHDHMRSKK
jgi:hypothetical protein